MPLIPPPDTLRVRRRAGNPSPFGCEPKGEGSYFKECPLSPLAHSQMGEGQGERETG